MPKTSYLDGTPIRITRSITITDASWKAIDELAKEFGWSKSELIERLGMSYLDAERCVESQVRSLFAEVDRLREYRKTRKYARAAARQHMRSIRRAHKPPQGAYGQGAGKHQPR